MFWDILFAQKRPIVGLSPMDGVTDAPFRFMVAKYGKRKENPKSEIRNPKQIPNSKNLKLNDENLKLEHGVDVMFSEFVSVDALHFATGDRRERLLKTFIKSRDIKPLNLPAQAGQNTIRPFEVAQVFGSKPELFAEAAELVEKLGFDGIDINMGCPAHKVEENGSGAGLIRTPKLAQEIIKTVKAHTSLPVSVKTRIGVDKDVSEWWVEQLMEVSPANISLHGRTLKQLYQGRADWESIGRTAEVVHKHGGHILGNGDIESVDSALLMAHRYGVDGVLIGRAAEGNPGIFTGNSEPTKEQRLEWMVEHARIFESIFKPADPPSLHELRTGTREERWFFPVRKHLAWYCKGFPGALELRTKLVRSNSVAEVEKIVGKAI